MTPAYTSITLENFPASPHCSGLFPSNKREFHEGQESHERRSNEGMSQRPRTHQHTT
jgi:hypothetical protein